MMGLNGLRDKIKGKIDQKKERSKDLITGTVVVMKKNFRNDGDLKAPVLDRFSELLGQGISFELISSTQIDPITGRGKVGKPAFLEKWVTTVSSIYTGDSNLRIKFEWDENDGIPGAVIVKNNHPCEFLLKTLTIDCTTLGKGNVHFVCNSWVYPVSKYKYDRIFFANDTFLPSQTPNPLQSYRDLELYLLRGDHVPGPLKEEDRVYGYAVYNDLGDPDAGQSNVRPILGGSHEKPYPRRGRTSRPPSRKDPNSESRITGIFGEDNYVPRDERFGYLKMSDFLAYKIKALGQSLFPTLYAIFDRNPGEFNSFQETHDLYKGGLKIPHSKLLEDLREKIPLQVLKEVVRKDGSHALRLPLPDLIKEDKFAWRADEEFARQMLAGVNPMVIRRLEEFPPLSKLDPRIYGNQTSTIKPAQIEMNMERFTVEEAMKENRLFILDHHDTFMPYLKDVNVLKGNFIYATRTLLFLKIDGTLKPLAIELSLPNPDGWACGPVSQVYTPCSYGVEGSMWQLAKAYAAVNDAAQHQLISHWLNTHAAMEPFVIATNRQLSVMHPINKLLNPHFRDTMNINALARQTLINAGGLFESTVFPGKYALEISSDVYKTWKLTDQSLPQDLLNRGLAVEDHSSPHKVRLLIKDYPYAADGLEIWSAIESWVNEYCSIYYPDDETVKTDIELQTWWKEIRDVGHGDLKDEPWWPSMNNFKDLAQTCTTMIWIASALHAAVNFGQYPYAGYHPSRPTISRRPMPQPGTNEYEELKKNPDKVFLRTITSQIHTIVGVSLIEILSRHSSDEVYLGQRDTEEWTSDEKAIDAFNRFSERLIGIERRIREMNADPSLKNRNGPVNIPYMLLYPNTSDRSGKGTGIVGMGIPNSVSI
ncbi:hypothetical protein LUZ60_006337 [Juncus effusus]|nr:hypothetical protein LUZ60_006337 [Juncus effusus]